MQRLLRLKNESQVYTTDNGVTDGGLTGLLPADKLSTNPIADGEVGCSCVMFIELIIC